MKYINPPAVCDICHTEFTKVMFDVPTVYGPWGCICDRCEPKYARKTAGQVYHRDPEGDFVKFCDYPEYVDPLDRV